MNELTQLLEVASYQNYDHNLSVLQKIKERLITTFLNEELTNTDFVINLYKNDIDENWFIAQCKSACNQIDKITNEESKFNKFYSKSLTEQDYLRLSQELLFDISELCQITGKKIGWEDSIVRANYLSSHQFFLHAKFAYFTQKNIANTTSRYFDFSSMPTLIRQAIELKVKNMIGLEKIAGKNGKFKMVSISALLNFFIDNGKFLEMPVSLEDLKAINNWTNTFIHTGIVPFCWQSLEAIDIIEDLFSIEKKETGELNLFGFSYIAKGISLSELKIALDEYFKADFTLNEKNIEGEFNN